MKLVTTNKSFRKHFPNLLIHERKDMDYRPSLYEQETVITFSKADADADIDTYEPRLIKRLDKLAEENPGTIKQTGDTGDGGFSYTIPKNLVRIRIPAKLSEEERKAIGRRLAKCRKDRKEKHEL